MWELFGEPINQEVLEGAGYAREFCFSSLANQRSKSIAAWRAEQSGERKRGSLSQAIARYKV